MNVQAVLEWLKHNVLIVVFGVIVLAAPVAMWFVSSGVNADVSAEVKKRADQHPRLVSLEKTDITPPGETEPRTGVLNQGLLDAYKRIAEVRAEDAKAVKQAALQHNQKGRTVLSAQLFPSPPMSQAEVLPRRFHDSLVQAYRELLTSVGAGMPPSHDEMREQLEREWGTFIAQTLRKDPSEKLEPEELQRVSEKLSASRMARYAQAAERVGLYASLERLGVPAWDAKRMPSMVELFNWQWQYWITQDVLQAVHAANGSLRTVTRAPVKEIMSLTIVGLPGQSLSEQGSSQGAGAGGAGFGAGAGGGGVGFGAGAGGPSGGGFGGEGMGGAPQPQPPPGDAPSGAGVTGFGGGDFSKSLTGRKSNNLYDVVYADVKLVVETTKLPAVLDAIAAHNFMTVTNVKLSALDSFEAVANGFFYGPAPICIAELRIETIWLREWIKPFMPPATKKALGIQDPPPGEGMASM